MGDTEIRLKKSRIRILHLEDDPDDVITQNGLQGIKLGSKCLKIIIDANVGQDDGIVGNREPFADPINHGDNGLLKETIEHLYSRINGAGSLKCQKCSDIQDVLRSFGKSLHALQDLYSHTTYVETFGIDVAKPGDLPLWKLLTKNSTADVPVGVISGNYPDNDDDPQSHLRLNKDSPTSLRGSERNNQTLSYFSLAENAATRHTARFWTEFLGKLRQDQLQMLMKCCQ